MFILSVWPKILTGWIIVAGGFCRPVQKWVQRVCTRVFLASHPDRRKAECCGTAVRTDQLRSQWWSGAYQPRERGSQEVTYDLFILSILPLICEIEWKWNCRETSNSESVCFVRVCVVNSTKTSLYCNLCDSSGTGFVRAHLHVFTATPQGLRTSWELWLVFQIWFLPFSSVHIFQICKRRTEPTHGLQESDLHSDLASSTGWKKVSAVSSAVVSKWT